MSGSLGNIISRLRYRFLLARGAAGFGLDYLERGYRIYLNHSKVIHYRNGCPVYSLTSPALFSKPFANFAARAIYRAIQNRPLPSVMSFAVSDNCNAHCVHCSFFERVAAEGRVPLSTGQCCRLIQQAQRLGVSVIQFLGGEPLLREDLPFLLRSVDRDVSTTVMFTNGWHLTERARDLKSAGLDSVFVSLDSSSPASHDRLRGLNGLFGRAVDGVRKARSLGMSTGFSCVLTPESFASGEMERTVELGRKVGVHEVLILEAVPVGRCQPAQAKPDETEWLDHVVALSERYNADASYPGVLVYPYVNSWRSVGCSGGVSYFYVTPYGDVCPCDTNSRTFGNVLETPLYKIWEEMTSTPGYGRSRWGGCRMKDPGGSPEICSSA